MSISIILVLYIGLYRDYIGLYRNYIGLYRDYIGNILGSYLDNGKEHGNDYKGL